MHVYLLCFFLDIAELVELMLIIGGQLLIVITIRLLLLLVFALQICQHIVQPAHRSHA